LNSPGPLSNWQERDIFLVDTIFRASLVQIQ